jgi:orotate phosphoribosyltransferase
MNDRQRNLLVALAQAGAFRFQSRGEQGFKCAHHDNKNGPPAVYAEAERSPWFVSLRTPENGAGSGDTTAKQGIVPRALIEEAGQLECELVRDIGFGQPELITSIPHAGAPFADGFRARARELGWSPGHLLFTKDHERNFTLVEAPAVAEAGDRIIVADDVLTLADVKWRFRKALPNGLLPTIVLLINREEGGAGVLQQKGIPFHAVFGVSEVVEVCRDQGLFTAETVTPDDVLAYAERRRRLVADHMDKILAGLS